MDYLFQLLFKTPFEGKILFKNQQDFANQLLTTPYFKTKLTGDPEEDREILNRQQSRIKTYISQLLSDHTFRSISEHFKMGLEFLLAGKLENVILRKQTYDTIIKALQEKNTPGSRAAESKNNTITADISDGTYISIIATKPFQSYLEDDYGIGKAFLKDIKTAFQQINQSKKTYRINFPTQNYCELFWDGLENLLAAEMNKTSNLKAIVEDINVLLNLETINPQLNEIYESYEKEVNRLKKADLEYRIYRMFSRFFVGVLNLKKIILVYHNEDPIYSIPIIAINPDLSKTKVYTIMEDDANKISFLKFNADNTLIWKFLVWDKVRQSKNAKNVPAPSFQEEWFSNLFLKSNS